MASDHDRLGRRLLANDSDLRRRVIADAIEHYLQRHPAAADSELGIAEWWLAEQGLEGSAKDVKGALEMLERKGVVEAVVLDDGRCVWRAANSMRGN
jgi:hypothetical protein